MTKHSHRPVHDPIDDDALASASDEDLWRTLCSVAYQASVREDPTPQRAQAETLAASLAARTGVAAERLQVQANHAAELHGGDHGTDADPDRFTPPRWSDLTDDAATAHVREQLSLDGFDDGAPRPDTEVLIPFEHPIAGRVKVTRHRASGEMVLSLGPESLGFDYSHAHDRRWLTALYDGLGAVLTDAGPSTPSGVETLVAFEYDYPVTGEVRLTRDRADSSIVLTLGSASLGLDYTDPDERAHVQALYDALGAVLQQ